MQDCTRTIVIEGGIGSVNYRAYKLIEACKKSLEYGIYKLKPNVLLSEYGRTVENKVHEYGYSVIKSLTGTWRWL